MVVFDLAAKRVMDSDLDLVRSGAVTEFRGLSRVTQDAVFWGMGSQIAHRRPGESMVGAVRAGFEARNDTPAAILFALYGSRTGLSTLVKETGARAGSQVAELRRIRMESGGQSER